MSDITRILKEAAQDVLTEDTLQAIEQAFQAQLDVKAEERSKIAVEAALNEQDEQYAEKLKVLLNAIDIDHCKKLKRVVEAIDKDRTTKLKKVIKKHQREITTEASNLKDTIVNSISEYLDVYLESVISTKDIQEAVKNKKAYVMLKNFRKVLGVDHALANESIKNGILDGKKKIDNYKSRIEDLEEQRNTLVEELEEHKKQVFLTEKTKNFDEKKTNFIKKTFKEKPLSFIKENFDYASKIFENKESSILNVLKEEAITSSKIKDVDFKMTINEDNKQSTPQNPYVQELSRIL